MAKNYRTDLLKPSSVSSIIKVASILYCIVYSSISYSDWQGQVSLQPHHVFRGVLQGDDQFTLQLSSDYHWNSGLYAGIWGSITSGGGENEVEINHYLGKSWQFKTTHLSLGGIYYDYHHTASTSHTKEIFMIFDWWQNQLSVYGDVGGEQAYYAEWGYFWSYNSFNNWHIKLGHNKHDLSSETYMLYGIKWYCKPHQDWQTGIQYNSTQDKEEDESHVTWFVRWLL